MLYLLTGFWQWFAVALFIGLAVGWLTTTRNREKFYGQGAIVTAAFVLAGGFLFANLQTIPGRAGLFLELALLAASAYGLGLPIGGGAKLLILGTVSAAPAKKKTPPIVVVRGKPQEQTATPPSAPVESAPPPAPVETASSSDAVESVTLSALVESAPPSAPVEITPTSAAVELAPPSAPVAPPPPPPAVAPRAEPATRAAPTAAGGKKLPGVRPDGLPAPRRGNPDDLSKIKGVGPKSVEKLHALGVYHFEQIAAWTPDNIKWISASLSIPGRIERGRWVAQAKELAATAAEEAEPVTTPAQ